jgi:hypothetical protein
MKSAMVSSSNVERSLSTNVANTGAENRYPSVGGKLSLFIKEAKSKEEKLVAVRIDFQSDWHHL